MTFRIEFLNEAAVFNPPPGGSFFVSDSGPNFVNDGTSTDIEGVLVGGSDGFVHNATLSGLTFDPDTLLLTAIGAVSSVNGKTGAVVLTASDVGADAAGTALGLVTALAAVTQPLNANLTAIAALTTLSYGRGLLELANAAAARVYIAAILPTIITDEAVTALGTSGAVAINAALHAVYQVTPVGNITFTVTNDSVGSAITIRVNASAFLITWSITGLKWVGGSAPTLPTVAGYSLLNPCIMHDSPLQIIRGTGISLPYTSPYIPAFSPGYGIAL